MAVHPWAQSILFESISLLEPACFKGLGEKRERKNADRGKENNIEIERNMDMAGIWLSLGHSRSIFGYPGAILGEVVAETGFVYKRSEGLTEHLTVI